jgi:hypothetical protein
MSRLPGDNFVAIGHRRSDFLQLDNVDETNHLPLEEELLLKKLRGMSKI